MSFKAMAHVHYDPWSSLLYTVSWSVRLAETMFRVDTDGSSGGVRPTKHRPASSLAAGQSATGDYATGAYVTRHLVCL